MPVTIGVMARPPIPGKCKTRLSPPLSPRAAAALYSAMLQDSLDAYATVEAARHVVMAAPEDDGVEMLRQLASSHWEVVPQVGDGLGARLAHAFTVLGEGGGCVALLDSDSPTVPVAPMGPALARMDGEDGALAGPCDDGGYYLIGLGSVGPQSLGILDGISWSTGRVMAQTRARCVSLGLTLDELPTWYDVDDETTLARIGSELRGDSGQAPRTAAWIEARAKEGGA